jgi:hypothetical protein
MSTAVLNAQCWGLLCCYPLADVLNSKTQQVVQDVDVLGWRDAAQ